MSNNFIIEYNNNLEDNDTLLNEIGCYLFYGFNNTIVYSIKQHVEDTNNDNDNNRDDGYNGFNNLNSIIFPTTSKDFSIFGLHQTIQIPNDSTLLAASTPLPLDHNLITNEIKKQSIKKLKSILHSLDSTRSYYTISYTLIRETNEFIEKSPILFYQVSFKDLENLNEIHQDKTKKIEISLIIDELNKSFYLFNYYSNSNNSIKILNNLLNTNNNTNNNNNNNNNSQSLYYYINNSDNNNQIIFSLNSNNLDKKLIDILSNNTNNSFNNNNNNNNNNLMNIISIELLLKITLNNSNNLIGPMISLNLNHQESLINLSNLCLISKQYTLKETIELLNKSILNQLNNKIINNNNNYNFKSLHFQFSFLPFPITTIYKIKNIHNINQKHIDDDENYQIRKQYHQTIGLPLNRPFLKSSLSINSISSSSSSSSLLSSSLSSLIKSDKKQNQSKHLKNVHLNLSLDTKTGGSVYLVDGSYDYYHYLQDNIDDNGWGCAYRSMQTICSWLKYQNYTTKSIPTHYEIQKTLIDLKDKDQSFLKSKQWIGAFEITLCLEYLYGIKCKILNITSGSEIIYKSRELAKHFQINGSPIMIGGGVLAYTLLGIDFNESTGETRYLILDPHYTGSTENIKTIKEKGWCGWKDKSLFRKDAFYNFCQPQIPNDL